ncbi:hypothetical protein SLS60_003092 [Paraconiothyrium brasiliense]|uniref:Peptidyl-tRNA hydrolase n=1 Tax=Paraconiothyrium brasiliense TaxID=300254 RepID=A0ABR3RUP4_9PLEO
MGKITPSCAHMNTPAPILASADHRPKNVDAPAASNDNDSTNSSQSDFLPLSNPGSRKERRRQIKHARFPSLSSSDTEPSRNSAPPNPARGARDPSSSLSTPSSIPGPMSKNAAQKAYPLLVCSIGNPGSTYAHTLHSAGHTITSHISSVKHYRPFTKGLSGLVARPDNTTYSFGPIQGFRRTQDPGPPAGDDDWTFWQSTSLMNVSGRGVARAWREFSQELARQGREEGRLVVVHDELESALGKVSVRDGSSSAKGHNGIKSAQASLGGVKWWRVGVGIGRPDSREPDVVANYVLRKMHAGEMRAMEKACGSVVAVLREIAEGKR